MINYDEITIQRGPWYVEVGYFVKYNWLILSWFLLCLLLLFHMPHTRITAGLNIIVVIFFCWKCWKLEKKDAVRCYAKLLKKYCQNAKIFLKYCELWDFILEGQRNGEDLTVDNKSLVCGLFRKILVDHYSKQIDKMRARYKGI